MYMSDPKEFLKQSGALADMRIESNLIDEMSHPQAYLTALILNIQKTFLERTNKQDVVLEEIVQAQRHTNGDVTTLKAEVTILKEKDQERTSEIINKALVEQSTKGYLMFKKPNWRTWTIIGGVLCFFGYDKLIIGLHWFWQLLGYLVN